MSGIGTHTSLISLRRADHPMQCFWRLSIYGPLVGKSSHFPPCAQSPLLSRPEPCRRVGCSEEPTSDGPLANPNAASRQRLGHMAGATRAIAEAASVCSPVLI